VLDSSELEGDFPRWKNLKGVVLIEDFRPEKGQIAFLLPGTLPDSF